MSAYAVSARGLAGRKVPQGVLTPMGDPLFAASEPGAWYDPSDMSTLFQDSAGTVPVTAVEQPVGRILDKSGRGNHATQATTTKRPVYSRRVNLLLATATLATQSMTTTAAAYTLALSGAGSVTLSGAATGTFGAGTHVITCTAGSLTLTVAGAVNDADFRLAVDAHLPYQWVNTATDYDADPSKFPAYLRFDGVDDALGTANIDFTGTDKMTVWAGVRSNLNGYSNIVELGPNSGAENGFSLQRGFAAAGDYVGIMYGTSLGYGYTSNFAAPDTSVIAAQYDIAQASVAGGEISFRRNGVVSAKADSQGSAGTGNFSQKPLYIGGRAGTSLPFNGRIYSLIVRGAQTPLPQIEATERYIKQKMGLP